MLLRSLLVVTINLLVINRSYAANLTEVEYYEEIIVGEITKAATYVLPKNATEYAANTDKIKNFGTYDIIIVGAGSTGSVIAARLSEIYSWRVLLLEAGTYGNDFIDIPAMFVYALQSKYNWGYESIPQEAACLGLIDRKCTYPRGKGVGGTSLINTVIYARGNKEDFDQWAAAGNPGWSYNDVLPYFKKSEHVDINDADPGYHGETGPLNVEYYKNYSEQFYSFVEGSGELGLGKLDYNGRYQLGVSGIQQTTLDGRRHNAEAVFLRPALNRRNLLVSPYSYVTKILMKKTATKSEARGVEFVLNGTRYRAKANREVILSAGAIASPQLLMLSGIGPRDHLESLGIPVVQDLSVGRALDDHPVFLGLNVLTNATFDAPTFAESVESYLDGSGPFTHAANLEGVEFFQSLRAIRDQPDLEYLYLPSTGIPTAGRALFGITDESTDALWGNIDQSSTIILPLILLHQKSKGVVELKSCDPFQYPLIDPRFLSDERDIETVLEGIQFALRLLETDAFKRINATLNRVVHPNCASYDYLSRDYWVCSIRHFYTSVYHPMSTCKMGPDPATGAVVDARLRVHGVGKLRVADTSIFPTSISGHPNAAAYMVGERFSDIFKQDYGFL